MSTAATRMDQDTKTLYVAFELGEKEWKLAMSTGLEAHPRLRSLRARGTTRLLEILKKERERLGAAHIVSCYEAGAMASGSTGSCTPTGSTTASSTLPASRSGAGRGA